MVGRVSLMKNYLLALLAISFLIGGCVQAGQAAAGENVVAAGTRATAQQQTPAETADAVKDAMEDKTREAATPPASTPQPASEEAKVGYAGEVLAGKSAVLLDFVKSDYDKALASDKIVFLYFYANWCPICRREVPVMQAAFDELATDRIIGFRVNYNDDQTDADETALAREFGVAYQHTKVALKAGERVVKSPEGWDKQRYLQELNKLAA